MGETEGGGRPPESEVPAELRELFGIETGTTEVPLKEEARNDQGREIEGIFSQDKPFRRRRGSAPLNLDRKSHREHRGREKQKNVLETRSKTPRLSPLFENYRPVLADALADSMGLSLPEIYEQGLTAEEIEQQVAAHPDAFKHLGKVLDAYKKDVLKGKINYEKNNHTLENLEAASDIVDRFLNGNPANDNDKGHDRIPDDKKVFAVKRKDGTWAVHTRRPRKAIECVSLSRTTLRYASYDFTRLRSAVNALNNIEDVIAKLIDPPQNKDEQVERDDVERVRKGVQILIEDYANRMYPKGQSKTDKKKADLLIAPLYAFETIADEYQPGKTQKKIKAAA